jgi:hypothetical protein
MDPYIESQTPWRGFHLRLIAAMAADLNRRLPPQYIAELDSNSTRTCGFTSPARRSAPPPPPWP